jgi:hypothetical protein
MIEPASAAALPGKEACEHAPLFVGEFVTGHRVLHDTTYAARSEHNAQYLTCAVLAIRQAEPRKNLYVSVSIRGTAMYALPPLSTMWNKGVITHVTVQQLKMDNPPRVKRTTILILRKRLPNLLPRLVVRFIEVYRIVVYCRNFL